MSARIPYHGGSRCQAHKKAQGRRLWARERGFFVRGASFEATYLGAISACSTRIYRGVMRKADDIPELAKQGYISALL